MPGNLRSGAGATPDVFALNAQFSGYIRELQRRQTRIETAGLDQRLVGPLGDDPPLIDYDDAISLQDSGQAVGDDQRGSPGRQEFKRLLDSPFGFSVEGRCGLVEQQDRRVAKDGPSDGNALTLAAR